MMQRRKFLRTLPTIGAMPFILNGIPFSSLAGNSELKQIVASCPNDRVLVILQLHGGNDGLNMLIPINDYDKYYNARPNIAISDKGGRKYINLDSTLPNAALAGLHPDMTGVKSLYDEGKVAIVQGVSYENQNQSHFRGRDVLFMGGGSSDYLDSGWVGRYLKDKYAPQQYPQDFPNDTMKDPLALEFGNEVSGIFHQGDNLSTSISINDPTSFFNLVNELEGFVDKDIDPRGFPPETIKNSPYGKELTWILSLEDKIDQYDDRLLQVYNAGKASDPNVVYPSVYPFRTPSKISRNPLTSQLKIIANLIHGGCQTKVYLVRLGGFDTHAQQVINTDASMGNHAALLYHISSAMKSFQEDLTKRNIEDRVLSITASEFGRRIKSNASYGTDHGLGSPVMIFGKGVNPGIIGNAPNLDVDNIEMQYDYRQLYASIMKDWMCADASLVDSLSGIYHGEYTGRGETLPIINNNISSINEFVRKRFHLNNCYPNPASDFTTISFYINTESEVLIRIMTIEGKLIRKVLNERKSPGEHSVTVNVSDLMPGFYIYDIKAGILQDAKRLQIRR